MAYVTQVTIADIKYNIAQASAVNQKKLMTFISARIAFNFSQSDEIEAIDVTFLVGALLALTETDLDVIADIVLYKTMIHGGDELVTVHNFQGGMLQYYQLIAEAIRANLSDFLSWLEVAKRTKLDETPKKSPLEALG